MGGHITVESKIGAGTTFSVLLPCLEPEESPKKRFKSDNESSETPMVLCPSTVSASPVKTSLDDSPTINAKVLMVDDSNFNQMVMRALLEKAGCTVLSANNGEEALDRFRTEETPFDVILMDITMPIVSIRPFILTGDS